MIEVNNEHVITQEISNDVVNNPDYPDYEDDEAKPDRLAELLLQSKFSCKSRKDGYYADEDVNCEVFHFCQDGVKHSWLCPNNAAFHQVHLICMPHSEDNICERSSKFHFVNDFLYKEVGDHPENRSYVERYYPQGFEGGVANIPDREGSVPPQAAQPPKYHRPADERPAPPPDYNRRHPQAPREIQSIEQQKQEFERRHIGRQRHGNQQEQREHELRPVVEGSVNQQAYFPQAMKNPFSEEKKKFQAGIGNKKLALDQPKFESERPRPIKQRPEFDDAGQHQQPDFPHPQSAASPLNPHQQLNHHQQQQFNRPHHLPAVVHLQPEFLNPQTERHRQQQTRVERPQINHVQPESFHSIVGS
ncbi:hypothetical protein HAZT_HAZT000879 [Hyalella azteca]|uniref:Chitin-binding type-2 domain-containing protein n=1 Tax=Hyalella azteca TaxID=294128 RepID=A0A6A0HG05_HYAAZ|nr:hypothetical protein HAZT_HAZT000879 [Hyalella azteca]